MVCLLRGDTVPRSQFFHLLEQCVASCRRCTFRIFLLTRPVLLEFVSSARASLAHMCKRAYLFAFKINQFLSLSQLSSCGILQVARSLRAVGLGASVALLGGGRTLATSSVTYRLGNIKLVSFVRELGRSKSPSQSVVTFYARCAETSQDGRCWLANITDGNVTVSCLSFHNILQKRKSACHRCQQSYQLLVVNFAYLFLSFEIGDLQLHLGWDAITMPDRQMRLGAAPSAHCPNYRGRKTWRRTSGECAVTKKLSKLNTEF